MRRLLIATVLLGLPAAGLAQAPAARVAEPATVDAPRDLVAALYGMAEARPTSPFFDPKMRARFFSKAFDALITAAETEAARDGDAAFDFDPVSASQDAEIRAVTLRTDKLGEDRAAVSARFLNHRRPTVVTYDVVRDDGAWKIDDIKGTMDKEAWSVRDILRAAGGEPAALPGRPGAPLPPKKDPAAR